MNTVEHNIPPVFDRDSEILILGSFPSVKSREAAFFYAHPHNRFWSVVAAVFDCEKPQTTEEKKQFLHQNHIALWDVAASCDICGSADASIRNIVPNDIAHLLKQTKIRRIYLNGKTAEKTYNRYLLPAIGIPAVCLPSTSPANAAKDLAALIHVWSEIRRTRLVRSYLGKNVRITIDRPLGYVRSVGGYTTVYPVNYGYIPGTCSADGEELDVYILGINEPVTEYEGKIIGIAYRKNDCEDKLIAAPAGVCYSAEEIYNAICFQEQWYDTEIEV